MIEILEGVFYDPSKEWYEQPQELIDLALEIEKTQPFEFDVEVYENHVRLKYGIWDHTTEMGAFKMRVDVIYLYPITNNSFLAKELHNKVTIEQIFNN